MKNTGKASEQAFENCIAHTFQGRAFVYRFEDGSDLHGLNGHAVKSAKKPADYLVCLNGVTSLAEVKSSVHATTFSFGIIKPHQLAAAKKIKMAGGHHKFYVHRLDSNVFYVVDVAQIEEALKAGKKSLRWVDLQTWSEYESYKRN